jgi:ferritin
MDAKIETALNDQMNFEMYSANIYLAMAAYFDSMGLSGFSHWMQIQYQEEMVHAMKFYHFINERAARVKFAALPEPPFEWGSPKAAFENALEHEKIVTGRINDLVSLAMESKDFATTNFLQWFVAEQVEEESSADAVIQKLTLTDEAKGALFMLDKELSLRVFTPPAQEQA